MVWQKFLCHNPDDALLIQLHGRQRRKMHFYWSQHDSFVSLSFAQRYLLLDIACLKQL
jgi:hypothetical protein